MAYIEQDGKLWRARWREGGVTKSSERTTKAKAQAIAKRMGVQAKAGRALGVRSHGSLDLGEMIERWLASTSSQERYQDKSRRTLELLYKTRGWSTVRDITVDAVKGKVKIGEWRLLRALLVFASTIGQPVDQGVISLKGPKQKIRPKKDLITVQQIHQAIAACFEWSPGNAAIAMLVARYGHRAESLVGLTCSAIAGGRLRVTVKSGDDVVHPMAPIDSDILHVLACGRGAAEPLFLSHLGGPWPSGNRFSQWYWHQIGKDIHPEDRGYYALKRFSITSMLDAGLDVATIASITGHRTPSTILGYARTNAARQARAIETITDFIPQTLPAAPVRST